MRQPVHALAFEVPLALTDFQHCAVDGGGINAVHVEGLDEIERLPLQRLAVGVVPEELDLLLVVDAELGDGVPHRTHLLFRLIGTPDIAPFELADGLQIETGAEHA